MDKVSVVIPTYNRCKILETLLQEISNEIIININYIDLLISNNSSTDNTKILLDRIKKNNPHIKIINRELNIGAEENFCSCLESVNTRFVWLIGDDDKPIKGLISKIINLLIEQEPDLIYLNPCGPNTDNRIITFKEVGRIKFIENVNVWITFISGFVFNYEKLRKIDGNINLRKYKGTHFIHLGWFLPLLKNGNKFFSINKRGIKAAEVGEYGYPVVTKFAIDLPKILRENFSVNSIEYNIFIKYITFIFIPKTLIYFRITNYLEKKKYYLYDNKSRIENPYIFLKKYNIYAYFFIYIPILLLPGFFYDKLRRSIRFLLGIAR